MSDCCTLPPREAPAIPLWINGRPVLAMVPVFHEVREVASQRLIRRVPLVDATLAATAITAASQSSGLSPASVPTFLSELGAAIAELEAHFAGLSAVESHTHLDAGKADVAHAIALIQSCQKQPVPTRSTGRVSLALAGAGMPLSSALALVLPALLSGSGVTLVPHLDSPSCALALAELCGQCGLPGGAFNVVYVADSVIETLVREPALGQVYLLGPSSWAQRWQAAAMAWPVPCERILP